ncbi:MAG: HAD family phosphatase, partial [Bacteroidales bacterium]|nr:HAD family phosphatase [Bacteroidales bacterium]
EGVKNIIFEFGNVIIDIDTKLSEREFAKHGLNNFEELYNLASQNELFDLLETGKISEEKFYDEFRRVANCSLPNQVLRDCWNALLIGFPVARLQMLQKMLQEKKYRTFILSNTNIIHYKAYTKMLNDRHGISSYEQLVEKAYFSHEIGCRKPGREIFEHILEKSQLKVGECLFVDDNFDNIVTANSMGFKTIHLVGKDITELNF